MRDRLLIYGGLFLFLALVTFPVWRGLALRTTTGGPALKAVAGERSCVAPRNYMRVAHMDLLMEWRDAKVRAQRQRYTAYDGRMYRVSLRKTCLTQCHGSKEEFCDRCHAFAGVSAPDCWGCHSSPPADPKEVAAGTAGGEP